jgi:hypothetical protein
MGQLIEIKFEQNGVVVVQTAQTSYKPANDICLKISSTPVHLFLKGQEIQYLSAAGIMEVVDLALQHRYLPLDSFMCQFYTITLTPISYTLLNINFSCIASCFKYNFSTNID